jgi:hypothetical protein
MAIVLAKTLREELCEMAQRTRAACRRNGVGASETVRINAHEVTTNALWKNGRGQSQCVVCTFELDGRRLGFNALLGKLEK